MYVNLKPAPSLREKILLFRRASSTFGGSKMSLIKNEKLEGSRVELHFSIAKADYEAAVERVYRREVKKMNIPGFRKGKAPRSVVEKMYGKGVFYEDALNALLPSVLDEAVKDDR